MFLIIRIPPQLAIVIVFVGMGAVIWNLIKCIRFLNKKNVATTDGQITECKSTSYYWVSHINIFQYKYQVEGKTYEMEDREAVAFRKNRKSYPQTDTVEYLKSNPSCSRLKLINRKHEILKCFLELIFLGAFLAFILIRYF